MILQYFCYLLNMMNLLCDIQLILHYDHYKLLQIIFLMLELITYLFSTIKIYNNSLINTHKIIKCMIYKILISIIIKCISLINFYVFILIFMGRYYIILKNVKNKEKEKEFDIEAHYI
jgi:cellulose synthase/poly-beta-1,6-N-acetylglucosamine synthase-like glycosyltransferase